MNILFIEDLDMWVSEFQPQLRTLGKVTHFDNVHDAINCLDTQKFDLIVCDHNLPQFSDSSRFQGEGTEIYMFCRGEESNKETPFIHFSSEPCPENYPDNKDPKFYSLKKEQGVKLLEFIKNIL